MKRTTSLLLAAAAGALLVAATGFHGGCGGGHRDATRMDQMISSHLDDALDDLHVTDAQRTQIHALKDDLVAKAKAFHAGDAQAKKDLLAQWDSATPDMSSVHALVDQRLDALKALANAAADDVAKLHAVLTPEQRAQLSRKLHRRVDR